MYSAAVAQNIELLQFSVLFLCAVVNYKDYVNLAPQILH